MPRVKELGSGGEDDPQNEARDQKEIMRKQEHRGHQRDRHEGRGRAPRDSLVGRRRGPATLVWRLASDWLGLAEE